MGKCFSRDQDKHPQDVPPNTGVQYDETQTANEGITADLVPAEPEVPQAENEVPKAFTEVTSCPRCQDAATMAIPQSNLLYQEAPIMERTEFVTKAVNVCENEQERHTADKAIQVDKNVSIQATNVSQAVNYGVASSSEDNQLNYGPSSPEDSPPSSRRRSSGRRKSGAKQAMPRSSSTKRRSSNKQRDSSVKQRKSSKHRSRTKKKFSKSDSSDDISLTSISSLSSLAAAAKGRKTSMKSMPMPQQMRTERSRASEGKSVVTIQEEARVFGETPALNPAPATENQYFQPTEQPNQQPQMGQAKEGAEGRAPYTNANQGGLGLTVAQQTKSLEPTGPPPQEPLTKENQQPEPASKGPAGNVPASAKFCTLYGDGAVDHCGGAGGQHPPCDCCPNHQALQQGNEVPTAQGAGPSVPRATQFRTDMPFTTLNTPESEEAQEEKEDPPPKKRTGTDKECAPKVLNNVGPGMYKYLFSQYPTFMEPQQPYPKHNHGSRKGGASGQQNSPNAQKASLGVGAPSVQAVMNPGQQQFPYPQQGTSPFPGQQMQGSDPFCMSSPVTTLLPTPKLEEEGLVPADAPINLMTDGGYLPSMPYQQAPNAIHCPSIPPAAQNVCNPEGQNLGAPMSMAALGQSPANVAEPPHSHVSFHGGLQPVNDCPVPVGQGAPAPQECTPPSKAMMGGFGRNPADVLTAPPALRTIPIPLIQDYTQTLNCPPAYDMPPQPSARGPSVPQSFQAYKNPTQEQQVTFPPQPQPMPDPCLAVPSSLPPPSGPMSFSAPAGPPTGLMQSPSEMQMQLPYTPTGAMQTPSTMQQPGAFPSFRSSTGFQAGLDPNAPGCSFSCM